MPREKPILVLLLSAFLLPFTANAQVMCAFGSGASSYNAYSDQRPSGDAMQLARQVNAALASACSPNCPTMAMFRNATAPNAMMITSSGKAKIVYAPQFFAVVYEKYGDGAIIAIIAHLAGHAIEVTSPAAWMKSSWTPELRADAWAGCALAGNSLSSSSLEAALTAVSMYPPASHQSWSLRIPALKLGYGQCGGDTSKFDSLVSKIKPK